MKNTYMKTFVVACVFALIGLQHNTVEAITVNRVVKGDSPLELAQQYDLSIDDIKQNNIHQNEWTYIDEMMQTHDTAEVLDIQSSEPIIEITNNTTGSVEQSSESEIESPERELENPAVSISNEEKDLFARLVEAEAKGEAYEGKVAVATVVLNRIDSPQFPNSVTDVIHQVVGDSYAFSPVENGEISRPASDESKQAVDEALMRKDRLNDSLYFYNPDIATDEWIRTREVVKTIGNHVFAI